MAFNVINTRADLDALAGTPAHAEFMAVLAGTIYRMQKDDEAQAWVAIEDVSTIERFGFVRPDFPDVLPPALPEYTPEIVPPAIVSPRQIRQALTAAGLRSQVEAAVSAGSQDLKDWWEFATAFEENHPMVVGMAQGIDVSNGDLHQLFALAASL